MNLLDASQYQAAAINTFHSVSARIQDALPLSRVEHVGSSSIPGAVSKGDLDVCVVVQPDQHQDAVSKLEAMGYFIKLDTLRTSELCMLLHPQEEAATAIQVVAAGSKFEFFMQFRDALREDPGLVRQYNDIKRRNATANKITYRKEKAKFIESVLKSAKPFLFDTPNLLAKLPCSDLP